MASKTEESHVADTELDTTQLGHTTSAVDVAEITTENPYTEINFIGTYAAIILGAVASYGGYVMPVTSLAFINADIGQLEFPESLTRIDNL